ncbi:WSSV435 [White spot syndrome virus]|uniref:WSSV435 n=1 Tax=White spot syndrome virus TaxID=342409 RepID=A0A2I6SCB4_9VIRU|nr:WSSV435 [White spot syndrome virus]
MGSNQQQSFISKRNGTKQEISLEKIIKRIENACLPVNQYVPKLDKNAINPQELASHIMDRLPLPSPSKKWTIFWPIMQRQNC